MSVTPSMEAVLAPVPMPLEHLYVAVVMATHLDQIRRVAMVYSVCMHC